MADIKFTPSQDKAIKHSGANLLVSAAAGSGKTAVVALRAVRLLKQERVPVNRLLLITFTKAAAAEMRERVAQVLKEKLATDNDPFLRTQLRALSDADICTIDSYLTKLLRRHYHAVDLDPAFSVLGEDEKENISQKALKKVVDTEFDAENSDFYFLCDTLGLRKSKNIGSIILSAYDYARKYPNYREFIASWQASYAMDEDAIKHSQWMHELLRAAKFDAVSALAALEAALKYALLPQGPANYAELLADEIKMVQNIADATGFDEIQQAMVAVDFARLPRRDKDCDPGYADAAKDLRNNAKKKISSIKDSIIFMPIAEIAARHTKMLPAMQALSRLVLNYDKAYTKAKRRYNTLDFSDLMHYCLAALGDDAAKAEERARYDFVFVDEYQDTNRLQEALISDITRGDNLFCVGDVKQSIYSFRQAEPSLFVERMDKSSPELEGMDHLIALSENFRSSPAVVDFINYVFDGIMTRKTGGIDYEGSERLRCSARRPEGEYANASAELYIIDAEQKDAESILSNIEYEAILAADKIKEIMAQPIYDGKLDAFRPAKYSDICILSRSFKPIVRPVRRILEQRGIPVTPLGETGYLDMLEIEIAVNILKIVDNLHRDVAMISAMNSPAFGFNIEELIAIRKKYSGKNKPYYTAVLEYAEKQKDSLSAKIIAFLDKIAHLRLISRHMPLGEFIWHMLSDTMLYDAVGALPGGRVRQQNLRILAERADAFSMKPGRNLSLFLEHLAMVGESNTDFEPAVDEDTQDSVKFMSVHKSKGLEFPVVILINTASGSAGNTDTAIMSQGLAPGVKCYDPDEMTKSTTLAYEASASSKKFTENAESLRILYVALTRARERLIILGTVGRGMEARIQSWTLPKQGELLFDKSFLDILAASAVRIHGNEISPDTAQVSINNVQSKIIPAYTLHHDKQKRKDAVLDALREAEAAPYPEDAFMVNYTKEQYIPAKTSATALLSGSPVQYELEDFGDVPDFMRDEVSYDAATRGTFIHTVMRFMDFAKGEDAIERTIDDLIARNILPADAKPEIDTKAISNFLSSDICKRIVASPDVRRETPFVLKLAARDVYCDVDSDRKMLVQGIIDLCFKENGYWILVDYKTNSINDMRTAESWLTHYTAQLETYKKALESLTGIEVREAGIYFLSKKDGQSFYALG